MAHTVTCAKEIISVVHRPHMRHRTMCATKLNVSVPHIYLHELKIIKTFTETFTDILTAKYLHLGPQKHYTDILTAKYRLVGPHSYVGHV